MKFTIIGLCLLSAATSKFIGQCTERKDIRDLSDKEFRTYIQAIGKLRSGGNFKQNRIGWNNLAHEYSDSANWRPAEFVEFNRMYLATVEDALQKVDCQASIPVWIPDVDDDIVFSSKRFGSMYEDEKCISGKLNKMTFQVNRTSKSQCISRYDQGIDLSPKRLHFGAIEDNFFKVAKMLHRQFKDISDIFQGTYTFSSAAYDPFFLSHIAYLDAYWARWQSLPSSKEFRGAVKDISYDLKDASFKKFKSNLLSREYSKIINKKCIHYKSENGLF